ncbi:DUF58 domain-containing protein [Rubritalea profundi]|uniref:DUF58 domain-containing protein n=1 Tax=Rubritalea profundi TaxID=1658618 RepID=A0A2S7U5T8_9BACT|nr:DUF58 domain-containing protein [Rubritalea profundi]PQJ29764.1 hypothetical protein BSZ32_15605 [Rubritalea profundi]
MAAPKHKSLTDSKFISQLDALYLLAQRILKGNLQADRRTERKGSGIDFADYAEYQQGDDYRAIDWKVYARNEQLLVKLFEVEEDTTVYLMLDSSPSMESKLDAAKRLTASLGYIALNSLDRLVTYSIADKLENIMPPARGRAKTLTFLRTLEATASKGNDTRFTQCCKALQARHRKKGIVIVISDFLFANGFDDGLRILQGAGHDVYCLQIHDKADLECQWLGDADLICSETGTHQKVTITESEAAAYKKAMSDWNDSLKNYCRRKGIGLTSITTEDHFEVVIQGLLRKGGLVA